MIRLWLSRGNSIPVREQLSAQLILGILSRRLLPGERLPSVRELARRLKLHPNTVSAIYQDLAKRGWVSNRRGSGVFVRDVGVPANDGSIERFVRTCVDDGLARGFTLPELKSGFGKIGHESPGQRFLVLDSDRELARILAAEIGEALGCTLPFAGCDGAFEPLTPETCVLVSEVQAPRIRQAMPSHTVRAIQLKSMQDLLVGHERPQAAVLIAVISRSQSILQWAWTLLSALGFPPDSLLQRNPALANWQEGLAACDIVVTEVVSARELPSELRSIVFRVVSDQFLAELQELANPLVYNR